MELTEFGIGMSFFDETAKEVENLIRDLPKTCLNKNDLEFAQERYCKILDYFQAQPHLIDPHLSKLMEMLVEQIIVGHNQELTHAASTFAAHLVKVRGYKVVVRHLPHEVKNFEVVLQLLEKQDLKTNWETRYVNTMWYYCAVTGESKKIVFTSGATEKITSGAATSDFWSPHK
jgi:hypothetical protein